MKKRVLSILLVATFLFSACGQTADAGKTVPETETQETSTTEESVRADLWAQKEPEETFTVSHKDEYKQAIYDAIMALPAEKPESSLKQKDVDCDTLQWFNTTYAMFTHGSHADIRLVGGYTDELGYVDPYVTSGLEQSWGITDRATAIESIAWLAAEGHVPSYVELMQMMDEYGMIEMTDDEVADFIGASAEAGGWTGEERTETLYYYWDMREINTICGENGIDAWDYCRIMQLCGSCYYAGYFTLEESLSIQLITAQAIQSQFGSWTEMNDSYYHGYRYWIYGNGTAISYRKLAYDELVAMENSPYTVLDFNMTLEKFW